MDGALSLKGVRDDFVIVDRRNYGEVFRAVIPCLDSSVEEVQGLKFNDSGSGVV